MEEKINTIVAGLIEFFNQSGFKRAVFGLSGGVDSALVAKLAVMALGKENVSAIILPNEGINPSQSAIDAEIWAKELGIDYHLVAINDFIGQYEHLPWTASDLANMNLQARIRGMILYHFANTHQALVLGTGNKSELTLGYFTKYGDGACDVLPIGNLYKTEVWEIGGLLGLPKAILEKPASAELAIGQTDEGEIGINYAEIDLILEKFEKGGKAETEKEKMLLKRIQTNKHKKDLPKML